MTPKLREQLIEVAARAAWPDYIKASPKGQASYREEIGAAIDAVVPLVEAAVRAEYEQVGWLLDVEDGAPEFYWPLTTDAKQAARSIGCDVADLHVVYRRVRSAT